MRSVRAPAEQDRFSAGDVLFVTSIGAAAALLVAVIVPARSAPSEPSGADRTPGVSASAPSTGASEDGGGSDGGGPGGDGDGDGDGDGGGDGDGDGGGGTWVASTSSSVPTPEVPPAPGTGGGTVEVAQAGPTSGASVPSPTTFDGARAEVVSIQTVPPVRDLIVEIDGVRLASDAAGRITVPVELRDGWAQIIGVTAVPALQRVEFVAWSDGDVAERRSLAELVGPEIQIGLEVSTRVFVRTTDALTAVDPDRPAPRSSADEIEFTTDGETIALPVDVGVWVRAAYAARVGDAFEARPIVYVAQASITAGDRRALTEQLFAPTPEALWVVTV